MNETAWRFSKYVSFFTFGLNVCLLSDARRLRIVMRFCIPLICILMAGGAFCLAEEPTDPQREARDNNRIAKDLLIRASELASRQDESQDFWTDRLLLQIGDVQMRAGDFEGARKSIRASSYAYGRNSAFVNLAEDLAGAGRREKSLEVLAELGADHGWRQDFINDGVRLRWIDYLIETDLNQAQKAVDEIESVKYRTDGLLKLAATYAKSGDKSKSSDFFNRAVAAAGKTRGFDRVRNLWKIAETQLEAGDSDAAETTIERLIDVSDDVDAWAKVCGLREAAVLSAKLNDRRAADSLFERAIESSDAVDGANKFNALKLIGIAQTRVGYLEQALETARRIPHDEDDLSPDADREQILLEVAKAQLAAKNPQAAEKTALSITYYLQYRDDALFARVDHLLDQGDFEQALEVAKSVHNASRRAAAFLKVAIAYADTGRSKRATEIASQIELNGKTHGFFPGSGVRFDFQRPETWGSNYELGMGFTMAYLHWSYERAAEVAASAMELAQALPLEPVPDYVQLLNDISSDLVIRAIARAYAAHGDVTEASIWARQIGSDKTLAADPDSEDVWAVERRINALLGVAEGILDREGIPASVE